MSILSRIRYAVKGLRREFKIIAILRIRNEELILLDTLNHLATFCDGIVVYDDASTDQTVKIAKSHPSVITVVRNKKWESSINARLNAETKQRKAALDVAMKYNPEWIFCADADERYFGDIRGFVNSVESEDIDGVRVSLFDAYMTKEDSLPYVSGELANFRGWYGPERRDILMMWRANYDAKYEGLDKREPSLNSRRICTKFYCQHFGKSISVEQWEETCDYYLNHFPYEPYGKKWESRKGKAIHTESDFGTKLFNFGEDLFCNYIKIHPGNRSILLVTHFLKNFTGSELAIYDLAREFVRIGYDVSVGAFSYQPEPLLKLFKDIPVRVIDLKKVGEERFDIIWSQHFSTIEYCVKSGVSAKKIIFSSLSPYHSLESPPICIDKISLFLANSPETRDAMVSMGIGSDHIRVFPNPSPREFFEEKWVVNVGSKKEINKIIVVSNTTVEELESCAVILSQKGIKIDFFGSNKEVAMITPEILTKYDVVVTIGRTVQYSLALGIPVYCYDRFGGPGYISESNIELARQYNFSGRCVRAKKSPEELSEEILSGFKDACRSSGFYRDYAIDNFQLCNNVEEVINILERSDSKIEATEFIMNNIKNRQKEMLEHCEGLSISLHDFG